jgi:hypothetical protein
MTMSRKNTPLYFLISDELPQELKVTSYPLHLTRYCLIPFFTCAHYFIYLKLGLSGYSDRYKLLIVKRDFNRTSLQV